MEENVMKWELLCLINELTQGKELAKQLCTHLSSSSSHQENEFLIEKILSSYEKALSMLNLEANNVTESNIISIGTTTMVDSDSPRSEVMDQEFKNKDSFKKRKSMPRWTKQVKVCPGTGDDGSMDDGHSWRKYGQKDILGAKFPRCYYRCTHRNVQGCLATKQVQRTDKDPTVLEINYRGRHTCKAFPLKRKMDLGQNQLGIGKHRKLQLIQPHQEEEHIPIIPSSSSLEQLTHLEASSFLNFETEFQVKTEDYLNLNIKDDIFPSFCFPSPPIVSENEDTPLFTDIMGSFSSTSESNIFCLSPSSGLVCQNVKTSESDVTDVVSAPTSVCSSPIAELDLFDFDLDFPEFFSSST